MNVLSMKKLKPLRDLQPGDLPDWFWRESDLRSKAANSFGMNLAVILFRKGVLTQDDMKELVDRVLKETDGARH